MPPITIIDSFPKAFAVLTDCFWVRSLLINLLDCWLSLSPDDHTGVPGAVPSTGLGGQLGGQLGVIPGTWT